MYNAINHKVAETCSSGCLLITDTIFFLLGHEWDKVCIFFIDIWLFVPGFECFIESYECMYIVRAVAFFWKIFSIVDLLNEVINWCGLILTCSNAIKIDFEVGWGDGSILSV